MSGDATQETELKVQNVRLDQIDKKLVELAEAIVATASKARHDYRGLRKEKDEQLAEMARTLKNFQTGVQSLLIVDAEFAAQLSALSASLEKDLANARTLLEQKSQAQTELLRKDVEAAKNALDAKVDSATALIESSIGAKIQSLEASISDMKAAEKARTKREAEAAKEREREQKTALRFAIATALTIIGLIAGLAKLWSQVG